MIKKIKASEVIKIYGKTVSTPTPVSFETTKKRFEKASTRIDGVFKRLDKKLFSKELEEYQLFKQNMSAKIDEAYNLELESCKILTEEKQKIYEELLESEDWFLFSEPKPTNNSNFYFATAKDYENLNYTNNILINVSDKKFKFKKAKKNKSKTVVGYSYKYSNQANYFTPCGAIIAQSFDSKTIKDKSNYYTPNITHIMIDGSILFDGKNYPKINEKITINNLSKEIDLLDKNSIPIYDFIVDSDTTNSFKELLANKSIIK